MKHPRLAVLVLTAFLAPAVASAQGPSWPGFRGPNHDGIARDAKPPTKWSGTENLSFRAKLPGPGSSSPILVGDKVLVTCYTGYGNYLDDGGDPRKLVHHLVAFDRNTGKQAWAKQVPGPLAKKARKVQISEHGFSSPTPVSDGKHVYCYFGHAGVVAFDLDGNQLWQQKLGAPSKDAPPPTNAVKRGGKALSLRWGSAASPILHGDLVIVNCSEQSNSIRALDRKTGDLVWKHESSNLEGCATTPAIFGPKGKEELVMVLAGEIWGMNPGTGKVLWTVETGTRGGMSPTPITDGKRVYTFGGAGKGFALRMPGSAAGAGDTVEASKTEGHKTEGEEKPQSQPSRVLWQGPNQDIPSPVLHDGLLFLVQQDGMATCVNADDGKEIGKNRLEGRTGKVYASPVIADGRMYVVSRKRGTFVYSADKEMKLLARNEIDSDDSRFDGSPAMAGDRIYLRSNRYLYCFQAKAQ